VREFCPQVQTKIPNVGKEVNTINHTVILKAKFSLITKADFNRRVKVWESFVFHKYKAWSRFSSQ